MKVVHGNVERLQSVCLAQSLGSIWARESNATCFLSVTFKNPVVRRISHKIFPKCTDSFKFTSLPTTSYPLFFAGVARLQKFVFECTLGSSVDVPRVSHTPQLDTG